MILQLRAKELHLASHIFHFLLMDVVARPDLGRQGVKGGAIGQGLWKRGKQIDGVLLGMLLGLLHMLLLRGLLGNPLLLLLLLHMLMLRCALVLLMLLLLGSLRRLLLPLLLLLLGLRRLRRLL